MKQVRIGLIGTGYIGRCHAIAYAQAPTVFPLDAELVLEYLAEITPELAEEKAKEFGFKRFTGDWRDIVQDPNVDVVDICTPNFLHKEIALTAIANGEIGEVVHFYGTHNEDYLANENTPLDWHCVKEKAGLGALGDLAAHIVQMSQYLLGQDIRAVIGDMQTVIKNRPNPHNVQERLAVENEDQATALVRFDNGCMGTIETSRIACGRKMGLSYVITGTKGSISYTQERMAELKLYLHDEDPARQGFKTILTGPLHPDYKNFCVSAGHGIGFNDQKTVEIRDLVNGLASPEGVLYPDFEEGYKVSRVLDAIALSYHQKRWVNVEEIA